MTNPEKNIEQLWYTWSDVGLGSMAAGFRIRAVSPSLVPNRNAIYSDRIRDMNRYIQYLLTTEMSYTFGPETAPVCLMYTHITNNEAIVVRKKYLGVDGTGRSGNYFSHLLGLGVIDYKEFSARDAICLWEADIWQDGDRSLPDRRSTQLPQETLEHLLQAGQRFKPDYSVVKDYLPFFIEAYLTRRNNAPLYLAAPSHHLHMIVYLIAGLTAVLPLQLLKDLTFSTFESDITKATTQIVGTSWIAVAGKAAEAVFAPQWFRDRLALNCDTGERSPLTNHLQVTNNDVARQFALYATDCLVSKSMDRLNALLTQAENYEGLSVENFLRLYSDEIRNAGSLSKERIETLLNDSALRAGKLSDQTFRNSVIQFMLDDPQWFTTRLRHILAGMLRSRASESSGHPTIQLGIFRRQQQQPQAISDAGLVKPLSLLAADAGAKMLQLMEQNGTATSKNIDVQSRNDKIVMLLDLMETCLSSHDPHQVWQSLFAKVPHNSEILRYLTAPAHQNVLFRLLPHWDKQDNDVSIGALLIFSWESLAAFLGLHLREPNGEWNVIVLTNLMQRQQEFTLQIAHSLRLYQSEILQLFTQLTSRQESLPIAGSFATLLLRNGYPGKLDYAGLFNLLVAHNVVGEAKELAVVLIQSGYKGNNAYKQQMWTLLATLLQTGQGMDLFDVLVSSGYFQKQDLVNLLLNSPTSRLDLRSVLSRLYRTPNELATFFVTDGRNYVSSTEQRQVMVGLFVELLPYTGKWERLVVLLDASHEDEAYVLDVLKKAALTPNELFQIVKTYGKSYLQNEQKTPELARIIMHIYQILAQNGFSKRELLLALLNPGISLQHREKLLQSLQLSSRDELREFFDEVSTTPVYASLLSTSPAVLELFTQLATLSVRGSISSAEKMGILQMWLRATQREMAAEADFLERLLQVVALTPAEKRQFLEACGSEYLDTLQKVPILVDYIKDYINNYLGSADLNRLSAGQATFFTYLCQKYQSLPLEGDTRALMDVYSSIANPDISQKGLDKLVEAVSVLALSDYSALTRQLAQAFVRCVSSEKQLEQIIEKMKAIDTRISTQELLYAMAEKSAAESRGRIRDENHLVPYLVFALTKAPNEQDPFTINFLKKLLSRYSKTDLDAWRRLNTIIMGQLPPAAVGVWRAYLRRSNLLERVVVELVAPFGANSASISGEAKHTLPYRLMQGALLFKYINSIADIWEWFVSSSASLHEFTLEQKEQIAIAVCFVQLCEFHDRRPITSSTSEFGQESMEWVQKMHQYRLKPASKKQKELYTLAEQWLQAKNVSAQNASVGASQGNAQNNSAQTP